MLRIEKLTEGMEMSKTAEEQEMEKIAHVVNVIDQAQTLTAVGEELYKIASEIESEPLQALAADLYETGTRMGACLTKTASESDETLGEALEIAEDLNKLASAFAEVADSVEDEGLHKMAEAVIGISNEMTEEANEVMEKLSEEQKQTLKDRANKMYESAKEKGGKALNAMKDAFSFASARKELATQAKFKNGPKTFMDKVKRLPNLARHGHLTAPAIAYGSAAAALAAAGYGAKKMHDKNK